MRLVGEAGGGGWGGGGDLFIFLMVCDTVLLL